MRTIPENFEALQIMLGWIFRKKPVSATTAVPAPTPFTESRPAKQTATSAAQAALATNWQPKLQAAMGDDAALLALAQAGAPLEVMQAAVNAIHGEAALKTAERELRNKDRRVHRLAKQRHLAAVAQREAREQAAGLIESAKALANDAVIPVNRLVDLDRAWKTIDAALLDTALRNDFAAALAQLSALSRERGDQALKIERWTAQARTALARLNRANTEVAAGNEGLDQLAMAGAAAKAALGSAPEDDGTSALCDALQLALRLSDQVAERVTVLDDLLRSPSKPVQAPMADAASSDAPMEATEVTEPATSASAPRTPLARWQQLPPVADAQLAAVLNQRFEQWQQAQDHARQARRAQRAEQTMDNQRAAHGEQIVALTVALERAEATLADGHLAKTSKHLVEIDDLLHRGGAVDALRSRIDTLQAEYARLKGWQHWGGGLARDELVLQAEALAAATKPKADTEEEADAQPKIKLSIKQQADLVDDLRTRWKELDKLGGATSHSLWQRFDEALKTAYEPVAAHVAAQRAAREQNLASRQQLVDALNALPLPDMSEDAPAPDWKPIAVALDRFNAEWRKLGPVEYTVPHKERGALMERMQAAVQRIETPLNEARRRAQVIRERLIARAKSLGAEATSAHGRDTVNQVRELQAEWQQHARSMPLARTAENALWTEFKTAIDAIFSARETAFNARDAEFKAHAAERLALIERVEGLPASDTPPPALKRALAEAEAQWQRIGPAPRQEAAALDSRFIAACDAVRELLANSERREWQRIGDALTAKLALCEEAERSSDASAAKTSLEQRWAELPALPAQWEQALSQRVARIGSENTAVATPTDELLLQLEAAFDLASPPAFQEARRTMKLQAMKAALEGRQAAAATPVPDDSLLTLVLSRTGLDEKQRERLSAVIGALFSRGQTPRR